MSNVKDENIISQVERFLSYIKLELNLSRNTVTAYGGDLRQWEQYLTGGGEPLDAASVTTGDLRAWILWLSNNGHGPRSIRRKVQAVRSFYKWLMRMGVVSDNPAAEVELARLPKQLPHLVRERQMDEVLDAPVTHGDFEETRNRLIVMILYETGMRRAELIDLQDANVDTAKGEMKVRGKRNKERVIPFGTELAQAIDDYRALRQQQGPQCPNLLIRATGEPLYPMLVHRVVTTALQQAGVTGKRSPHVLRHSFATAMLSDGAGLNSVKDLLGHASLATTQIYTHVTFSELKNNYKLAHPRALKKGG